MLQSRRSFDDFVTIVPARKSRPMIDCGVQERHFRLSDQRDKDISGTIEKGKANNPSRTEITEEKSKSVRANLGFVSSAVLHSQVVNLFDEILDFVTILTIGPLAAVTNAPVLVVDSDSAALGYVLVGTSLNRLLEEMSGECPIVDTQAVIQFLEIDSVLQSAVLGKIFGRNLCVVA